MENTPDRPRLPQGREMPSLLRLAEYRLRGVPSSPHAGRFPGQEASCPRSKSLAPQCQWLFRAISHRCRPKWHRGGQHRRSTPARS